MKPSEYLFEKKIIYKEVNGFSKGIYCDDTELCEKVIRFLDKRFIDREELKKVLKKLSEYYQENWDWPGSVFTEEYNKDILELLENKE